MEGKIKTVKFWNIKVQVDMSIFLKASEIKCDDLSTLI